MELKVHYDSECDALGLHSDRLSRISAELETVPGVVLDLANDDDLSCQVVGLEVLGMSAYVPLGKLGYCEETDTLTFGAEIETAIEIVENEDLAAHWRPDDSLDDFMVPVAFDLRNASKHLAPIMASWPKSYFPKS